MLSILPAYAELHVVSCFSFLRGASHPEELVARAARLGYTALAVTDEGSLAGVVRAHVEAKKYGLHLIIGTEITLECGLKLVLLAMNRDGYGNIAELLTVGRRRAPKGTYLLRRDDIVFNGKPRHDAAHLRNLMGCYVLYIGDRTQPDEAIQEQAEWVAAAFHDRVAIAVELQQMPDDDMWQERLATVAKLTQLPMVAAGDVHMHVRSRKPLHDTITAIRLGKSIAECGLELHPNAEQHLRQRIRLAQVYARPLLEQTLDIAARCTFSLDEVSYRYPDDIVPIGETPTSHLRKLTYQGAFQRYPNGIPTKIQELIEHELALIAELEFDMYFLVAGDIVAFARRQEILCQGRGSAANSVVAYCLCITEVDPSRMNLLFERFVSRSRKSEPPDIDIDFEHEKREIVIQEIYRRYGRHRAALTGAVITFRPRSAIKDVGKALGMDFTQLNALTSSQHWWNGKTIDQEGLREHGLDPDSPVVKKLVSLSETLLGFPRQLSQHVGGFVIAQDSLCRLVPIENAAMTDRTVIEFDKDDIEHLRFIKVDILALGILSAIRRALDMISERRGEIFTMQDVPSEDPATYEMICRSETVGVFQIESRAQRSMLLRMQPRSFFDLVVEVALVRPGPIHGEMVHPYLRRRQGLEPIDYPSEEVREILGPTLGIPIFQEQLMQLAMACGGFSADEADQLRRALGSWKKKGQLEEYTGKLVTGMLERGYSEDYARRMAKFGEAFASYSFPLSHSASFALLVYVSAWLKCHEPAIFLASLLNSQPMGFYTPSQLIQDAKRFGVKVRPIDVMVSQWDATLEEREGYSGDGSGQPIVRLGLRLVKGLSIKGADDITMARAMRPFSSVDDMARRANLSTHDLQALAKANALIGLAGHRRQAAWEVAGMRPMPALLRDAPIQDEPLELPAPTEGEEIVADYHSTGLTLRRHPLALLRERFTAMNLHTAEELQTFPDRKLARTTGIVTGRQRPGTANGVMFVTIEDETGTTQVIVWPSLVDKQKREVLDAKLLTVYGVWQRDGASMHLIAKRLVDHTALLGALNTVKSRDFH
ncbi:error-prone DNA polymerase [Noviherbaspirillum malthae]|uniref:error-prone DNA polymerase n=1 Tax=Noviherbaspirillum malthae TaxID=1260987 RepID=UPI00189068C2|nr:error-prone DNA polymerase [Noviherbaspirillum malthae]